MELTSAEVSVIESVLSLMINEYRDSEFVTREFGDQLVKLERLHARVEQQLFADAGL